jgi:hypothetical protein
VTKYLRENGVELRPGVRVFCTDRDERVWEDEGTIVEADDGVYKVDFGPAGTWTLDWRQVSPTAEEVNSDAAKAWRAARQLKVFLCHGSEKDLRADNETFGRLKPGRGPDGPTIVIRSSNEALLDHFNVLAGPYGLAVGVHCDRTIVTTGAFDGGLPPWSFRRHRKDGCSRATSPIPT